MLQQPAWLPGTIPGSIDTSRIRSVLSQCGVSAMAVLCYAHGTRGRVLTGLSEAALTPGHLLVGDVQCSIWPMTPVEPSAPPVSVTRVGRVMALRKRNQTQQAEKNQNFKYHFHIPLSHTTAEINQKVVYTTFFREMVNSGTLLAPTLAVARRGTPGQSAVSGLILILKNNL